jgi:hypothetical protein
MSVFEQTRSISKKLDMATLKSFKSSAKNSLCIDIYGHNYNVNLNDYMACKYINIHIYVHLYMRLHTSINMYVYTYIYVYEYLYTHLYVEIGV